MRYLLDTNLCVDWLRGNRSIAEAIDARGLGNCAISEITKAELLIGERLAESRGRKLDHSALERLLTLLQIVPIGNSLEFYAAEKVRLMAEGRSLEDFDLLIGCTAVTEGYILVTGNVSHMGRISGIRLESC